MNQNTRGLSKASVSFLPIVIRELSLASRRRAIYRIRFYTALVPGVIVFITLATGRRSSAQMGQELFFELSLLAFAYALLSGVRCTADSLSQEKREGTLGLLFLTTLRGYDVVLGKLVVTSLDAVFGLISMLPILVVPVLLGSVTGSEFWRMNLLLVNALVLSLALGLLVSTYGQNERGVLVGTLLLVLSVTLGLPLLWKGASFLSGSRWFDFALLFPSPAYAFRMVSDSVLRSTAREYRLSMCTIAGVAASAILLSSSMLPRLLRESGRARQSGRWAAWWHRRRFGDPLRRRFRDAQEIEAQPFGWLVKRDRLPGTWLGVLTLVLLVFAFWAPSAFSPSRSPATAIAVFGVFGLHQLCKLLVVCEASRQLHIDKRSGALELLLSTPISIGSILQGQLRCLRKRFVLPFIALVLINWLILLSTNSRGDPLPGLVSGIFIAPFDFYALSWLGMLTGLREPRYAGAVFRAFGAVMAGPWVVVFLFALMSNSRGVSAWKVHVFFFWWFCLAAAYDLVLARWARTELLGKFRQFAANEHRHRGTRARWRSNLGPYRAARPAPPGVGDWIA